MKTLASLMILAPLMLLGCGKGEEAADTEADSGGKSDTQVMMDLADAQTPEETMAAIGNGPGATAMGDAAGAGGLGDLEAFDDMGVGGGPAIPTVQVAVSGTASGRSSAAATPRPDVSTDQMTEEQAATVEAAARYRGAALGDFPAYEQVTEVVSGDRLRLASLGLVKLEGVSAPREAEAGQHVGWMLLSDLVAKRYVWVESHVDGEVQIVLPQPHAMAGEPAFIDINASMNACLDDMAGATAFYGQTGPWDGPHLAPVSPEAVEALSKHQAVMQAAIEAENEAAKAKLAAEAAM